MQPGLSAAERTKHKISHAHLVLNRVPVLCLNSPTVESNGSYLERVDVESSHWPRVPVALSDDHVALSSDDLCRVVQDDVAVLASCNEDPRGVTLGVHSVGTPHQFVVSVGTKGEQSVRDEQLR